MSATKEEQKALLPIWALCVCCNSMDYCRWNQKMEGYICAECSEYWKL